MPTHPLSVAYVGSFEAIFEGMFGPQQHDQHVVARKRFIRRQEHAVWLDAADERVRAAAARIIRDMRAKREARQQSQLEAAE